MTVFFKNALKYLIALSVTVCLVFAVLELLGIVSMADCFSAVKNLVKNFLQKS